MRILALSDVALWKGCQELVTKHQPHVVVLAGDLTSDGCAAFWTDGFEAIPAYRKEKQAALRRLGITVDWDDEADMDVIKGGSLKDIMTVESTLKVRFQDTPEFTKARHKLHTSKFYSFLQYAGQRAVVLVVKGDHDDDFPGDYQSSRIDRIGGCQEISGKTAQIGDLTFLGLGYDQAGFRTPLRQFVRQYQGVVDIVIAHPPQKNVPIVAELKPRLLVRGHSGGGKYLVNGVPTVFTACGDALIEMPSSGLPKIQSTARFPESLLLERYDWLAPYPTDVQAPP